MEKVIVQEARVSRTIQIFPLCGNSVDVLSLL